MAYQPIKFTKKQYNQLKRFIRKEFGNVSLTKGIYLITYIYSKHTSRRAREHYRKKYYTSFDSKKRRCSKGKC